MDSEKEYGFRLTDMHNLLTEDQYNELAYNIREFCFAIAAQTIDFSIKQPLALAMHWKGSIDVTIYSDSKMTYFGLYDSKTREIRMKADISDFTISKTWLSRFLGRCERRIIERKAGNVSATVQEEILVAWDKRLKTIDKDLPSNVPCREYEISLNTNPQFIEVEDMEEHSPLSFGK